MSDSIDTPSGYKETLNDIFQVFRSIITKLICKRGRTIRRVILSKNMEGKNFCLKIFKIQFLN